MRHDPAFWIDAEADRVSASDGVSRYSAYVRHNLSTFDLDVYDDPAVRAADFAATAWRIATSPVMSPGYVRYADRVLTAGLARSYWDGSLLAAIDLAVATPPGLARTAPGGGYWRGWSGEFTGPTDEEVTRQPYALTTTRLMFTVPAGGLPVAPPREPSVVEVEGAAHRAVAVLVRELNAALAPVLVALGGGRS